MLFIKLSISIYIMNRGERFLFWNWTIATQPSRIWFCPFKFCNLITSSEKKIPDFLTISVKQPIPDILIHHNDILFTN